LPPDPDSGREQSTVSYECDFDLPPQTKPGDAVGKTIFIPWQSFNPTYRGRVKKDAKPLDTKKIKRMSIMIRSYFGAQEGEFSLTIKTISAVAEAPPPASKAAWTAADDRGLEAGSTAAWPPRTCPYARYRGILLALGVATLLVFTLFRGGLCFN